MIEKCIADWHDYLANRKPENLEALIAEDCVFLSPIVFTPQKGRDLTIAYLRAAGGVFGGAAEKQKKEAPGSLGKFKYVKQVLQGNHAVLEFETEMGGKYVNGVDIITCNDEGRIAEFKVMIRPLQAVNFMHAAMKDMLEKMHSA